MDGHDLREYTPGLYAIRWRWFRKTHLFNDTHRHNIAFMPGRRIQPLQIEEAARMAYAMDFINKMDNAPDTIIGENGVLLFRRSTPAYRDRPRLYRATARFLILMKLRPRGIPNSNVRFRQRWMSCRNRTFW